MVKIISYSWRTILFCCAICILFTQPIAVYASSVTGINMTPGATPVSHHVYDLHMTIMMVCALILMGVYAFFIWCMFKYRRKANPNPATFSDKKNIEVIWIVVPFIILIIMAVPATITLFEINDDEMPDFTVKVTGYQWKWRYAYLDHGIDFISNLNTPVSQIYGESDKGINYLREVDAPLVVPVNQKIRFLLTSNDVLHSWWVPEIGMKRDAIPGIVNEMWAKFEKTGTYRGQCAELCGWGHAFMPIVINVVSEEEFENWVLETRESQKIADTEDLKDYTFDELLVMGEQNYNKYCSVCHQVDGLGQLPIVPPLMGSSVATGEPISRHIDILLNGVPGSLMQAFGEQLGYTTIASIITYERNAWGNDTMDIVQPQQVREQHLHSSFKMPEQQP